MFIEQKSKINKAGRLSIRVKQLLKAILLGFFFLLPLTAFTQDAASESAVYIVRPGDTLTRIAVSYGNPDFWESIFEANRDVIKHRDVIYTGQELIIPPSVAESKEVFTDVDEEQSQQAHAPQAQEAEKDENKETLEQFRQAFNRLVTQEAAKQKEPQETNRNTGDDYDLDIGGLIINETRSKMGSDFYTVFYKHWNAPKQAGNFILTISEQPMPSMGTLVTVKIDNQPVFKTRLQPRYAVTEKLAKQAVAVTYYSLNEQLSISSQITTY